MLANATRSNVNVRFGLPIQPIAATHSAEALSEQIRLLTKTSEPDFAAIDFLAFFRVDLSGSMAAPSI
jgi:hypothetical protein